MEEQTSKRRMPLEELVRTVEYSRLTPKQQLWISTYIESGALDERNYDAIFATRTAYNCRTEEVARVMSYSILDNVRVIAVLNLHFGADPLDAFLKTCERAAMNRRTTAVQMQILKIMAEAKGYISKLPVYPGTNASIVMPTHLKKGAPEPKPEETEPKEPIENKKVKQRKPRKKSEKPVEEPDPMTGPSYFS